MRKSGCCSISGRKTLWLLGGQLVSGSLTFRPEVMTFWRTHQPAETSKRARAVSVHAYYGLHLTLEGAAEREAIQGPNI